MFVPLPGSVLKHLNQALNIEAYRPCRPNMFFIFILLKKCLFSPGDIFFLLLLLEREGGKKNINAREEHRLVASLTHWDQRLNPQPSYVSWPGIEPTAFWLGDDAPTNWAIQARAKYVLFQCHFTGMETLPSEHYCRNMQKPLLGYSRKKMDQVFLPPLHG